MANGGRETGFGIEALDAAHAVCRLPPDLDVPDWVAPSPGALLSVTRTDEELSIVCAQRLLPPGVEHSRGWRALRVLGTLEHSLVGVLASLAGPLAAAEIPLFAISSFDTDYVLVPDHSLQRAFRVLEEAGHSTT